MTLTIIRGLPGSGKSKYAFNEFQGCFIVDMNALSTAEGFYDPLKSLTSESKATMLAITSLALMNGTDVVVVNQFLKREDFERYLTVGKRQGAVVRVIKIINKNIHTLYPEYEAGWEDFDGETVVAV